MAQSKRSQSGSEKEVSCSIPVSSGSLSKRLAGLQPVYAPNCRVLILGSFPSPASLIAQQYYGHPQNHFWSLLAAVLDEPLPDIPYAHRIERIINRKIGIWDVYQNCIRPGALDANIRSGNANDFPALLKQLPYLERLCFNGKTAGKFAERLAILAQSILQRSLEIRVLPSSSPAYTLPFARKLECWREAIFPLEASSPTLEITENL